MIVNELPYECNIVADSISPQQIRLTSIHVKYPRFIHSELMTHRVFSRNARSSRAVPTATLLREDPYMPHFMMNRPGMQALEEMPDTVREEAERIWYDMARHNQAECAKLHQLGVHKQWANRPLEWFGFIHVLITSTNWQNFWDLRIDSAAQPELQFIAAMMHRQMSEAKPRPLQPGEWHLPWILEEDRQQLREQRWDDGEETRRACSSGGGDIDKWYGIDKDLLKISTARCARLSYVPFDGTAPNDYAKELSRYEGLIESLPPHASPAEHQATPDKWVTHINGDEDDWEHPMLHGNFEGWIQHRKTIPGEVALDVR